MAVEVKAPVKGFRGLAQRYLNVGLAMGFFLVLLTYFAVSQQFSLSAPNAVSRRPPVVARKTGPAREEVAVAPPQTGSEDGERENIETRTEASEEEDSSAHQEPERPQQPEDEKREEALKPKGGVDETTDIKHLVGSENGKPICDTENPVSDTCNIDGDVRTNGTSLTVMLVPPSLSGGGEEREWRIRPYARKTMSSIREVTVKQLSSTQGAAPCTVRHDVPAIVFALGGLIGNYWHDFSDMLVPLFIASRQYNGEVQFLISNIQPWWLGKYGEVVSRLSKYDVVDFDRDAQCRCFPHVTVGLRMHKEFSIRPEWAPGGYSMADFTQFLRETYSLPRAAPVSLRQSPGTKPRLMLLHRGHYRKFTNVKDIAGLAEKLGFEVVVMDPKSDVRVADTAKAVNSFDVLVGVHGAGLTNAVFLPANAVMVQVVPYGKLEHMARVDFGEPAADMGLRYIEYSVSAEESTLLAMLGREHPVIRDPEAVHRSGWDKVAEFYLGKQDVRIDVNRFAPTLLQALDHLRQ